MTKSKAIVLGLENETLLQKTKKESKFFKRSFGCYLSLQCDNDVISP